MRICSREEGGQRNRSTRRTTRVSDRSDTGRPNLGSTRPASSVSQPTRRDATRYRHSATPRVHARCMLIHLVRFVPCATCTCLFTSDIALGVTARDCRRQRCGRAKEVAAAAEATAEAEAASVSCVNWRRESQWSSRGPWRRSSRRQTGGSRSRCALSQSDLTAHRGQSSRARADSQRAVGRCLARIRQRAPILLRLRSALASERQPCRRCCACPRCVRRRGPPRANQRSCARADQGRLLPTRRPLRARPRGARWARRARWARWRRDAQRVFTAGARLARALGARPLRRVAKEI